MTTVRQAGAIAVRTDLGPPRFLLVTANRNPAHWIFPKGHVEPGESVEAAALRELGEEAGALGELVGRVGTSAFRADAQQVEVTYYLVRLTGETVSEEGRQRAWLEHGAARRRLTFEDTRRLLDAAAGMLAGG